MNTRIDTVKVIGFSVPTSYAERIDSIARRERRTKRSVFQAMVDLYEETQKKEQAFQDMVMKTLRGAEQEKTSNPKNTEELLKEFRKVKQENLERNKELGISYTDEDINTMVYGERKEQERRDWVSGGA